MKSLKKLAMIAVATTMCAASFALLPACSNKDSGHEHAYEWTQTKAPTCTEKGEFSGVCAEDQATLKHEVPAAGHAYGDWVITEAPTASKAGKAVKICATDKTHKLEQELPVLTSDKYTYADGKFTFKTDNGDIQFAGVKCMTTVADAVAEAAKNKPLVRSGEVVKEGGADPGEVNYAYGDGFVYVDDEVNEVDILYSAAQWKDEEDKDKSGVKELKISKSDGTVYETKYASDEENPKLYLSGYEFNVYSGSSDFYYGAESFLKDQYDFVKSTEKAPNFLGENADLEKGVYTYSYGESVENSYLRVKVEFKLSDKNTLAYMKVTAEMFGEGKYTEADGVFTLNEGAEADSTRTVEITQTAGNADDVLPANPENSFKMTDFAVKSGDATLGAEKEKPVMVESERFNRNAYAVYLNVEPANKETALQSYDKVSIYLVKDEGEPVKLYGEFESLGPYWGESFTAYKTEDVWVEYDSKNGFYKLFTKKLDDCKLRFVSQKSNITKDVLVGFDKGEPGEFSVYLPDSDTENATGWKEAEYQENDYEEKEYLLGNYYIDSQEPFKFKVDANVWLDGKYCDVCDNSGVFTVTKGGQPVNEVTPSRDANDLSLYTFAPTVPGEYTLEFTPTRASRPQRVTMNLTVKDPVPYDELFSGTYCDEKYGATVQFFPNENSGGCSGNVNIIRAGAQEALSYTYTADDGNPNTDDGFKVTPVDASQPHFYELTLENKFDFKLSFKLNGKEVTTTLERYVAPAKQLMTVDLLKGTTWEYIDSMSGTYKLTFNNDGTTGTLTNVSSSPSNPVTTSSTFSYVLNVNAIEFSNVQGNAVDFSADYANGEKTYFKEDNGSIVLNLHLGFGPAEENQYDGLFNQVLTAEYLLGTWTAPDLDNNLYKLTFKDAQQATLEYWGMEASFTWALEEGALTFTVDDTNAQTLQNGMYLTAALLNEYTVKGNTIVISDSQGNLLNFTKKENAPLTEAEVLGAWTASLEDMSGSKTYTLTFNNGTGSISDGSNTASFGWAVADGKLTFTVGADQVSILGMNMGLTEDALNAYDYDGTTLAITNDSGNVLEFTKQAADQGGAGDSGADQGGAGGAEETEPQA